jgi:hypothetical protein
MRKRIWSRLAAITLAFLAVGMPNMGEAGPGRSPVRSQDKNAGNTPRIFQDPASTRGYENGYDLGLLDARKGERYDPVRHRDYRDANRGYASSQGSRDGYKTNFRTGFRQGYEDGYREGTRTRK